MSKLNYDRSMSSLKNFNRGNHTQSLDQERISMTWQGMPFLSWDEKSSIIQTFEGV